MLGTLPFDDVMPSEGKVFGAFAEAIFLGESHGGLTIFVDNGRRMLHESEFLAEVQPHLSFGTPVAL